jgi:hypothetical protein
MPRIPVALATLAALALAVPAEAGPTVTYKGQAKSLKGDFRYGKVRFVVRDSRVRRVTIESVTTTGCGGFMTLVFAPSSAKIVSGSTRIRGGRFSVKYRPEPSVEDQTTTIKARVRGRTVTGTFASGTLCGNAGRFTARR